MKIRTVDQLLDRISSERVWRIREISSLRSQCFASGISINTAKALRRSFIPIAYAHWEGFVKKTASYYLEFVAMQRLQLRELNSAFVSLYLWKECAPSIARGKAFSLVDVYDIMIGRSTQRVWIQYKDVISTSNLDFKTLTNICATLGLSPRSFETKAQFINLKLVGQRNYIAHGENQEIGTDDLEEVTTELVILIDLFRNEVENAVISKAFKRAP